MDSESTNRRDLEQMLKSTELQVLDRFLTEKQDEIDELREELSMLKALTWPAPTQQNITAGMPLPRLEIERTYNDRGRYNCEWEYRLVYKHFLGDASAVLLGITSIGGSRQLSVAEIAGDPLSILPHRDGIHFRHDCRHLGFPGFVLIDGSIWELKLGTTVDSVSLFNPGSIE